MTDILHDPLRQADWEDPRVTIARDVLEQIKVGRLKAMKGFYLRAELPDAMTCFNWTDFGPPSVVGTTDIKTIIAGQNCRVCAKGALFVAKVDRVNGLSTDDMPRPNSPSSMETYLAEFSKDEHRQIEGAFEGRKFLLDREDLCDDDLHDDGIVEKFNEKYEDVLAFHNRYPDPTERMVAIMQNIIDNGGDFSPWKL